MTVNEHQFGDFMITRKTGIVPTSRTDVYRLYQKVGEQHVYHGEAFTHAERGRTTYAGPVGDPTPNPPLSPREATQGFNRQWAERNTPWAEQALTGPKPVQLPLFRQSEESPRVVKGLWVSKQTRHLAPLLLGVAQHHAMEETGKGLAPDTDLSKHSARMVKHLKGQGIVGSSASAQVTNSIGFSEPYVPLETTGTPVPRAEVEAGRSMIRSTLRQGRQVAKQREAQKQRRTTNRAAQGRLWE